MSDFIKGLDDIENTRQKFAEAIFDLVINETDDIFETSPFNNEQILADSIIDVIIEMKPQIIKKVLARSTVVP